MPVTVVAGVPGVGVSAVCERARRSLDDDYELVNFGDVMLEQAATHGLATQRHELAGLSRRETARLQRRAGEYVADRSRSADVLLSTHLAVETDAGVLPGFPPAVLEEVDPEAFVLVEADPATVLDRRASADRDYGDLTARRVDFLQDLGRSAAFDAAHAVGARVELVENEDDVETAARTLVRTVAAEG